jgi:hypothetical protein
MSLPPLKIEITTDTKQAVASFFDMAKTLREMQGAFRAAQADVQRLARDIQQAETPSQQLTKDFETAKAAVARLSADIGRQRGQLRDARGAPAECGVDVAYFADYHARLTR